MNDLQFLNDFLWENIDTIYNWSQFIIDAFIYLPC